MLLHIQYNLDGGQENKLSCWALARLRVCQQEKQRQGQDNNHHKGKYQHQQNPNGITMLLKHHTRTESGTNMQGLGLNGSLSMYNV
jgi:hypothetical protein